MEQTEAENVNFKIELKHRVQEACFWGVEPPESIPNLLDPRAWQLRFPTCLNLSLLHLVARGCLSVNLVSDFREAPVRPAHHVAIARTLARAGFRCDCRDTLGMTALQHLCSSGMGDDVGLELMEVLLEEGASPNTQSVFGTSPLQDAVMSSNVRKVELLLEHGADPNLPDNDGMTPMQTAMPMFVPDAAKLQVLMHKFCGKYAPDGNVCANPSRMKQIPKTMVKRCARCLVAVYCGVDCQRQHWKVHKAACGVKGNPVIRCNLLEESGGFMSTLNFADMHDGKAQALKIRQGTATESWRVAMGKPMKVKIQVMRSSQGGSDHPFLVYNKDRSFQCQLDAHAADGEQVAKLVLNRRVQGPGGAKGHFVAWLDKRLEPVQLVIAENLLSAQLW